VTVPTLHDHLESQLRLSTSDPELAEEIKKRMFVFEDIVVLDRKAAGAVVQRTDPEILLCALKAAPPDVQSFIWESMPPDNAAKLKKRLQEMGPVRLHEVEKAHPEASTTLLQIMEEGGGKDEGILGPPRLEPEEPGEDGPAVGARSLFFTAAARPCSLRRRSAFSKNLKFVR
jgi:hypothetical protein